MTTETVSNATNDIRYKVSKTIGKEHIIVSITLNDECKNGHQDFHATADIYEAGKPHTDRNMICCGCCHEEILKAFPQFKIFVALHGCDYEGIPTYAVENGFYHLTRGFNNTKPDNAAFKPEFCEYYRISADQFDVLATSRNQLQYALHLQNLGILAQWNQQANKAIATLEEMTGKQFIVDSKKTQYHAPTEEQLKEEAEKQANGYYTPQAEQEREEAKKNAEFEKLEAARTKELNAINEEYDVKRQVLTIGGTSALHNCIYYNHSRTLSFNWRGYDTLPVDTVNAIIAALILPEGVKAEISKNK